MWISMKKSAATKGMLFHLYLPIQYTQKMFIMLVTYPNFHQDLNDFASSLNVSYILFIKSFKLIHIETLNPNEFNLFVEQVFLSVN